MGLDGIFSVAEQLGRKHAKKDQQQQDQQDDPSQTSPDWAEAGSAAQQAYENFQADKAQGKGPNYTEIGSAAQKAFSAYQRSDDGDEEKKKSDKELGEIGKEIAAGFGEGEGGKDLGETKAGEVEGEVKGKLEAAGVDDGGLVGGVRQGGLLRETTEVGEEGDVAGDGIGRESAKGRGFDDSGLEKSASQVEGEGTLDRGRGGYNEASAGRTDEEGLVDAAQRAGATREEAESIGSYVETGRRALSGRGNDREE